MNALAMLGPLRPMRTPRGMTRSGVSALAAVGVACLLGSLSACSGGSGGEDLISELPAQVFSGGGGTLTIRMEVTQPSEFHATFEELEGVGEGRTLSVLQEISVGSHERTVEVSPGTYLYFELGVPEATPGARIEWTVLLDGRVVVQEDDTLDGPLESGFAFFLQFEADDVAQVREWTR